MRPWGCLAGEILHVNPHGAISHLIHCEWLEGTCLATACLAADSVRRELARALTRGQQELALRVDIEHSRDRLRCLLPESCQEAYQGLQKERDRYLGVVLDWTGAGGDGSTGQ